MVKQIIGDLIRSAKNGEFEVIAHQCNCFNTMGAGIARSIRLEWQEAADVDNATQKGDPNKLGTITYTENTNPIIVNLYGQFDFHGNGVLTNYDALEKALMEMKQKFPGKKIGMPKVGSLRARGDWSVILPIIEKVFSDPTDDVTIVEWEQDATVVSTVSSQKAISSGSSNTNYGKQTGAISKLSAFNTPSSISVSATPTASSKPVHTKKKFKGTRKCRICHTEQAVKNLYNYMPSVWVCKTNCHEIFMDNLKNLITQNSMDTASNPQVPLPSSVLYDF